MTRGYCPGDRDACPHCPDCPARSFNLSPAMTCKRCLAVFDAAVQWTICPHPVRPAARGLTFPNYPVVPRTDADFDAVEKNLQAWAEANGHVFTKDHDYGATCQCCGAALKYAACNDCEGRRATPFMANIPKLGE